MASVPELQIDPFGEDFLTDPYPRHEAIRNAGPVVRLTRYGIWGMARHAEVSTALQDWKTFCSGRGAGLSDFAKEKPWRPPSIILEADPPLHTRTRGVLGKVLSRPALMRLREEMDCQAETLLDDVLTRTRLDGFADLAQAFPLRVFPDAVGLVKDGRENLLPYGDMAFNAFGPRNALLEASMRKASEVIAWISAQCRRSALSADGFGAQIYAEVDAGVITEDEAGLLVRSLLTAGLDTTIHTIAHALLCFASWPTQWRVLREKPVVVRGAFEEVMRFASPVQTFFRTTTAAVEIAGITIPEGEKVLLFLAAANRDPRRWNDPDRFDIQRDASGHVAFGYGIHQCVGQMVARMEVEALLGALVKRVDSIELAGEARIKLNNTLRGVERLPLRMSLRHSGPSIRARPGALELRVARKQVEAIDVCSFELVDRNGEDLPAFAPGAHVDVELPGGMTRQYSLCNDSAERHRYVIAVLRERTSRGGSKTLHDEVSEGDVLRISTPKNHFRLTPDAPRSLLLAAGIGVTPLLCMAEELARLNLPFELNYCARSRTHAAFLERISSRFASQLQMHFSDAQRIDLRALLAAQPPTTHIYMCGPRRFMDAALETARATGWPEAQLHYEFFAGEVVHADTDVPFEVQLASSGRAVVVAKDQTIAQALATAGIKVPVSCEQGVCGTCLTRIIEGVPDHRDSYLTPAERAANDLITPCCSRARSPRLVLDL